MFDPAKQVEALQSTRWWVAISIAATVALFGLRLVFQPVNAVICLYRDKGGEESKITTPPPKPKPYHMTTTVADSVDRPRPNVIPVE
jgi:hypothetical protein